MKIPEELLAFIKRGKQFFIATHVNPDGDALGASLALATALETIGKKTTVYDKDPVPVFYRFLPGWERVTDSILNFNSAISNFILVDCNDIERAGLGKITTSYSAVIDHHETVKEFGDVRWIVPEAPATGVMIFYLMKELGVIITKEIATNLYAAVAVDTGTFRYSNTTPDVLKIAAELIDAGADPFFIAENLYETWSESRFRLLMNALNTLEIQGNAGLVLVTQEMLRETGAKIDDIENFTSFPRMLKSVRLVALFKEIDRDFYKVSLRSKGETNVSRIAEMFGGGGHRNAAGYKIRSDFKTAKESLLKEIRSLPIP